MNTRKLETRAVLTQCVGLLNRQLRYTQHPRLRRAIEEAIDYFGALGRAEEYDMIVSAEEILLLHDHYEKRPNLKLLPEGRLFVGRLDEWLEFNDPCCLLIAPRGAGTAECGRCIHGIMTGERITEKPEYRQGRAVTLRYPNRPLPDYLRDDAPVDNDYSRNLLGRLLRNRTIGRKDFLYGSGLLLAFFYLCRDGAKYLLVGDGHAASYVISAAAILFFGGYILLVYKRVGDLGLMRASRAAAMMIVLCCPVLFLLLLVMRTRVMDKKEYIRIQQRRMELHVRVRRALARRCDVSEFVPAWY